MGTSKTQPASWMLNAGNEKTNGDVIATSRGWERQLPNGKTELLLCMKGLATSIVQSLIESVTFQRKRNLSLAAGDKMTVKVNFTEKVYVSNGQIKTATVNVAGVGYLASQDGAAVTIQASGGGGVQAVGTLAIDSSAGIIGGVTITSAGSGYTTAADNGAAVTFSAPHAHGGTQATGTLIVTGDAVVGVTMTNRGAGYDGTETITIPAPTGGGTTATMTIALGGTVSGIDFTNRGTLYAGTETITAPAPGGALPKTTVTFNKTIGANNAPTVTFKENGVTKTATFNRALSDDNTLVFEFTVTALGAINTFTTSLTGSAEIIDVDNNNASQAFPAGFSAPTMTVVA